MKVLHQDARHGEIKMLIDTLDDLWYLCNIIEVGDLAFALTYRKDETKDDKIRPDKARKRPVYLGVHVEKVEFHEFSNRLRISGTIIEDEESISAHHTLNLEIGDDLKIVKDAKAKGGWKDYQLQQIREAINETNRPLVTFLALDRGEATIAELRQYGVQQIACVSATFSGKQYEAQKGEAKEFYGDVLAKLKQAKGDKESTKIIVLGPGFEKDSFLTFAKEREPKLMAGVKIDNTAHSGMVGIYESIKRGTVESTVKESRASYEIQLIEELLAEIAKDNLAVYGPKEVESAVIGGAVKMLLVTDVFVREKKAERIAESAKHTNTKMTIVSTSHDGGKKLEALGGVAGLLRYKIK